MQPRHWTGVQPGAAPALNTILAVREHAPAEIDELDYEIRLLQHRLGVAHACKRLLERLLDVISQADGERVAPPAGTAVVSVVRSRA